VAVFILLEGEKWAGRLKIKSM